MMRLRSLRGIAAVYVLLILFALIALRFVNYHITHAALAREVDRRLATEMSAIVDADRTRDLRVIAGRIAVAEADHDTADLYYLLVDAQGNPIAGKLRLRDRPTVGYADFTGHGEVDGVGRGRSLTRRLAGGGTLVVLSDTDAVDSFDALSFRVQLLGLGATTLIVIGGAMGILVAIRRRMAAMRRTVDAVMAGDLGNRIAVDGSRGEFDLQAAAFNAMLDRIEDLMASVRHATKDVTHELKSPLARLRSVLAALERRAGADPLAAGIADARAQTDEILALFASLLRLWEIEGGHRRERFVAVDLGALATEVGETLDGVAEDADHVLVLGRIDRAAVYGDVHLLRQMLVNLVENAIRHTPAGTRIAVSVERRAGRATIVVADSGPGIAAADHALVVRRFGRLADRDVAGQGIGLTLVDAIARLHGGTLMLDDAGPGLRVTIGLPIGD